MKSLLLRSIFTFIYLNCLGGFIIQGRLTANDLSPKDYLIQINKNLKEKNEVEAFQLMQMLQLKNIYHFRSYLTLAIIYDQQNEWVNSLKTLSLIMTKEGHPQFVTLKKIDKNQFKKIENKIKNKENFYESLLLYCQVTFNALNNYLSHPQKKIAKEKSVKELISLFQKYSNILILAERDIPLINYYQGQIALLQNELVKATNHFELAVDYFNDHPLEIAEQNELFLYLVYYIGEYYSSHLDTHQAQKYWQAAIKIEKNAEIISIIEKKIARQAKEKKALNLNLGSKIHSNFLHISSPMREVKNQFKSASSPLEAEIQLQEEKQIGKWLKSEHFDFHLIGGFDHSSYGASRTFQYHYDQFYRKHNELGLGFSAEINLLSKATIDDNFEQVLKQQAILGSKVTWFKPHYFLTLEPKIEKSEFFQIDQQNISILKAGSFLQIEGAQISDIYLPKIQLKYFSILSRSSDDFLEKNAKHFPWNPFTQQYGLGLEETILLKNKFHLLAQVQYEEFTFENNQKNDSFWQTQLTARYFFTNPQSHQLIEFQLTEDKFYLRTNDKNLNSIDNIIGVNYLLFI